MNFRFYIDPETDLPHIYNHDVTEDEVKAILKKPGEDRRGTEGARVAIGQTEEGRYIKAIYVPDPDPKNVFIITAFELSGKPLAAYKRRKRKKHEKN